MVIDAEFVVGINACTKIGEIIYAFKTMTIHREVDMMTGGILSCARSLPGPMRLASLLILVEDVNIIGIRQNLHALQQLVLFYPERDLEKKVAQLKPQGSASQFSWSFSTAKIRRRFDTTLMRFNNFVDGKLY